MAAVSGSSVYSNFSNGSGINSKEFGYDKYMKQNPKSQLYKMDIRPDEFNSFELSARTYENKFTRRDITSDDYYIKYHYTPFSELIDFNVTASTSRGNQKYRDGSLYTFYKTSAQNRSDALDINNTSRFTVADNDLEFMLGSKLMRTRYDRTIHSAAGDPKANQESIENNPFAPSGQQDISALYTGLKVTRGIWEADFNLNYTRNRITGYKPACDSRVICVPQGSYDIDDKEGGFNPSVQLSAQVTPWLQPFIGYSKSMRAPNIQEMFFSNSGGASMNPFLKPERAETWQAGFNIDTRDLLVEQDALRFKALAYRSRIQNYIYSESYLVCSGGRKCSLPEVIGNGWEGISDEYSDNMYIYVNSASDVIAKGFELEMDYDAGFAFGRLSFSQQQTDQPTFVVVFDHDDRSGTKDGLYIFDLRDGKQLGYVHTGAGANAVKYNPKYNELYVTNFTSGTISVVDATKYSITREFNMPVYPNQMVLSDDMDTLYIGIKEGFNRDWDPDVFVEGAKERILSIDLKKS
ncbi:TonB-dependent receptor [Escherichia coli]|nr:TonB-dependent receptor [Escherichia coli]